MSLLILFAGGGPQAPTAGLVDLTLNDRDTTLTLHNRDTTLTLNDRDTTLTLRDRDNTAN